MSMRIDNGAADEERHGGQRGTRGKKAIAEEEEKEEARRRRRERQGRELKGLVGPTAVFREARNYAARPPRKRGVKIVLRSSRPFGPSALLSPGPSRDPPTRRPLSKLIFY